MAQLIKTVDKTSVTFQDTFTYIINVGFSGIVGNISDAKVTDFIPKYLSYTLPPISNVIKSIEVEELEEGDLITFNFGEITDLGISIAILLRCKFVLGTDTGATFTNNSDLYINFNQTPETSAQAPEVTLNVVENFEIEKNVAVPVTDISSPGGRVIYTLILENILKSQGGTGDPGASINNIVITDTLPDGISLDPNYPVVGYDISNSIYADTRYNGQEAEVLGNNITFTMPNYYGTRYRIILVCIVDENVSVPSEIDNTATLEISQTIRNTSTSTLEIGGPSYVQNIGKSGPNYAQVGNYISYDLYTRNDGNQDNTNVVIEENIPDEVNAYRLNSGRFSIDIIEEPIDQEYTITYFINNEQTPILLQTCNLNTSSQIILPVLPQGQKITKLVWNIPNMPVGAKTSNNIVIDGIIISTNANNIITNTVDLSWDIEQGRASAQAQKNTIINEKSQLNVSKGRVGGNSEVIPQQIIRYSIAFNADGSQINDPVASDLLSEKLEYVGNEVYTFYDYFDGTVINSTNSNFFNVVPIQKSVIANYNNTGRNFVRYTMDNFSVRQKGWFRIEFDARVKIGASGTITNNAILGNVGDNGIVGPGQIPYPDVEDRDNDNITQENLVISSNFNTNISYYAVLKSDKKVKGALDSEYHEEPEVGLTYAGGSVAYKLTITNAGNLNYEYIEIVDILPHIGDTGVIINQPRLSEFPVFNVSTISARVFDGNTDIGSTNLEVEYSQSYNPVRFSATNFGNDTIGVDDDWSTTLPTPITSLKSVKINTVGLVLLPNQSIVIDMICLAPSDVLPNNVAWNSFAVKARYRDENNIIQNMIPVEPEKVGVEVLATDNGSISGYVWIDSDRTGNVNPGDVGQNGVAVRLYKTDNTLVAETITVGNSDSEPGYYLFNNIDIGSYYVVFERPDEMYFTISNANTQSKANSITGKTPVISITSTDKNINNIDAGLLSGVYIEILILELIESIYSMDCGSPQEIADSINEFNEQLIIILGYIAEYCITILNSNVINDYGYKVQVKRLLDMVNNMKAIQTGIVLQPDECSVYLQSNLLAVMLESLLSLLPVLEWLEGTEVYYDRCCTGQAIYLLMVGRLINSITCLNPVINQMIAVKGLFIQSSMKVEKSYMPIYVNPMPIVNKPIQAPTNCFDCGDKRIKH